MAAEKKHPPAAGFYRPPRLRTTPPRRGVDIADGDLSDVPAAPHPKPVDEVSSTPDPEPRGQEKIKGVEAAAGADGELSMPDPEPRGPGKIEGAPTAEGSDGEPCMPDPEPGHGEELDGVAVLVRGKEVPAPVKSFVDARLAVALSRNVRHETPTPLQRYALPILLAGRDLMVCAPAGSGRTTAFGLPIISRLVGERGGRKGRRRIPRPRALVLVPTRQLAAKVHEKMVEFCYETQVKIVAIFGGGPVYMQVRALQDGVDMVIGTPGRLNDLIERAALSLDRIKFLVLDHVERMVDDGLEPQIRAIVERKDIPTKSHRQTMIFTEYFSPDVQRMASDFLSDYVFCTVGNAGPKTEAILQKIFPVQDFVKSDHLMDLLCGEAAPLALGEEALTVIFVDAREEVYALEYFLQGKGFLVTSIHEHQSPKEREHALKLFKSGATPILIATDMGSYGSNISNVAHVISYDLPKRIEDYLLRIGRVGKAGLAIGFFNETNRPLARDLWKTMALSKQDVPDYLIMCARAPYSGVSVRKAALPLPYCMCERCKVRPIKAFGNDRKALCLQCCSWMDHTPGDRILLPPVDIRVPPCRVMVTKHLKPLPLPWYFAEAKRRGDVVTHVFLDVDDLLLETEERKFREHQYTLQGDDIVGCSIESGCYDLLHERHVGSAENVSPSKLKDH